MRPNKLREIWASGKTANNVWLSLSSVYAAELIAHQGWDSVTVDLQHAPTDFATAYAMLVAISTSDAVPLVRVPWNAPDAIMRVLDAGAYGVISPMVETAEEARAFVSAARYAPLGMRSVGPNRASLYGGADYIAGANETVLTLAQIETARGLENVEAIARTPGLDVLFVGPSDLSLSLTGVLDAEPKSGEVFAAIQTILKTAHAHDRKAAIFVLTPDYARQMFAMGFDLVTLASDAGMLKAGKTLLDKL